MKYKLCVFDLDGTTADSVGAIAYTANLCLEEVGLSPNPEEDYKIFAGEGQYELIKRALKAAGDTELKYYDKVMTRYISLFEESCTYNVHAYPGIKEMLDSIKERGLSIAILSNKHHENAVNVAETIFGKGYFDEILGQMDSHERKPSPEGLNLIMEHFNIKPKECLYIGDTATDMLTGSRAGTDTVGVTWGFRTRTELCDADATYIVDSPKEILELL